MSQESGTKNLRLHFAEFNDNNVGDQVFNVLVNGVVRVSNYDILSAAGFKFKAVTLLISGVAPDVNGVISLEFRPEPSVFSTASVNGIEVLNS